MAEFLAGTSGWNYGNWRGSFYPADLPAKKFLEFYARSFRSAEVNYSFYHMPRVTTYENWFAQTPDDFVFALKLSRFITHIKRLHDVRKPWSDFIGGARSLKRKLGPILMQFPPSFHGDEKNLERLDEFLGYAAAEQRIRMAFEFRHNSCFDEAMLAILRRHKAALVIAHSSRFPVPDTIATGNFVYFRFHGPKEWCASSYADAELKEWGAKIKSFMREGIDAYAYFNNDARCDAAPNALRLREIVEA
jgi:uncharacterized protein YecE (DUF72 family)